MAHDTKQICQNILCYIMALNFTFFLLLYWLFTLKLRKSLMWLHTLRSQTPDWDDTVWDRVCAQNFYGYLSLYNMKTFFMAYKMMNLIEMYLCVTWVVIVVCWPCWWNRPRWDNCPKGGKQKKNKWVNIAFSFHPKFLLLVLTDSYVLNFSTLAQCCCFDFKALKKHSNEKVLV